MNFNVITVLYYIHGSAVKQDFPTCYAKELQKAIV